MIEVITSGLQYELYKLHLQLDNCRAVYNRSSSICYNWIL